MEEVNKAFNTLARQHTVLCYELGRLRNTRGQRPVSTKTEYEERLEEKIALLDTALRALAKIIEQ